MRVVDTILYGAGNIKGSPVRTFLLLLAMSIGVASVVMLSSLGEAARLYVVNQFSALGTHLLQERIAAERGDRDVVVHPPEACTRSAPTMFAASLRATTRRPHPSARCASSALLA